MICCRYFRIARRVGTKFVSTCSYILNPYYANMENVVSAY